VLCFDLKENVSRFHFHLVAQMLSASPSLQGVFQFNSLKMLFKACEYRGEDSEVFL
jgi:hypothetical protein